MTIQSYIEHLKTKPEHIKSRIAFGSAFGITLIIFVFWFASVTSVGTSAQDTVAHAVSQAGTPVQSLTASVGGFFSSIKDLIFTPRKVTYADVQVTPGK
jgi:hypothetical protein